GRRHHPSPRRPASGRRRDPPGPADATHDQDQPVLGLRLQHRRDPAGRLRPAQPDARWSGDGPVVRVRGEQQPAAADLQGPRGRHQRTGSCRPVTGPRAGERLTTVIDTTERNPMAEHENLNLTDTSTGGTLRHRRLRTLRNRALSLASAPGLVEERGYLAG